MLLLTIEGSADAVNIYLKRDGEPCGHFAGCPCEAFTETSTAVIALLNKEYDAKTLLREGSRLFVGMMRQWRKALKEGNRSLQIDPLQFNI